MIPFLLIGSFLAAVNAVLLGGLMAVSPPARRRIAARFQPFVAALTQTDIGRQVLLLPHPGAQAGGGRRKEGGFSV